MEQVVIFHTNDIHSRLENFARMVTFFKKERANNDLLLDAGDFHDFMRIEINGTQGKAGRYLLEKAQYDAIAVGNNEGFAGEEYLSIMANTTSIPMLSCNLFTIEGKAVSGLFKSCFLVKNNYRFLIIGASPTGDDYNQFYNMLGVNASDVIEAIKNELINNQNQYDFCVLLSHLGYNTDIDIAKQKLGIDVIIGGHSHTDMEKALKVENTIIHQSGGYGEKFGKLTLMIDDNEIVDFVGVNIDSNQFEADAEIMTIIETQKQIAIANLRQPLYVINKVLWHDVIMENPLTNFICDALYDTYSCDLAIMNSGIASCGISGAISKMKLLNVSPSPLNPTLVKIKGKNILLALKASLDDSLCLSDGSGPGFRGKYLGRLHVSDNVIIQIQDEDLTVKVNDEFLDNEKFYLVATSDYLQRGTGYSSLASNLDVEYKIEYIRDLLEATLNEQKLIDRAFNNRYQKSF